MNVKDLAAQVIEAVRDYVARTIEPLTARLAEIERRPVPADGKSVTVEELRPMVDQFLRSIPAPKDGKDGEDGKSVTLEDVRTYLDAELATWALGFERRAQDVLARAIDKIPAPKDGKDGLPVEEFEVVLEGRALTLTIGRGELRKSHTLRIPALLDAGVFRDGATYEQGDGVTFGGSYWIAQKDAPEGKPGLSSDWRLAVKKGRDGKDWRALA